MSAPWDPQFLTFPQCKDAKHLNVQIGEWYRMRDAYGGGVSADHLRETFVNILPNNLQDKVNDRRDSLTTLDDVARFVQNEISRCSGRRLAGLQEASLKHLANQKREAYTCHL